MTQPKTNFKRGDILIYWAIKPYHCAIKPSNRKVAEVRRIIEKT
ncbi:hypothetical protein [Pseudanabaena sp. UWO310]|nr:hypothetical protein [Pseudanabaena sp. UWO310]